MTSPERLSSLWNILLDLHVRIAKPDNLCLVAVLYIDLELLSLAWGPNNLVYRPFLSQFKNKAHSKSLSPSSLSKTEIDPALCIRVL